MTSVERTHRWRVALLFVLFTSTAGLYLEAPSLFSASLLGIAYVGYPLLVGPPTIDLDLSRTVSDGTAAHDDPVVVTVTITNTGSRTLTDLRVVDGVPALLSVVDGTPRHTAALRPGASTSFQYTVAAKHGDHRFEPATAIAHDISGSMRIETEVGADQRRPAHDDVECPLALHAFRLRRRAGRYPGRTTAETGGSGIEFQRVREHQRTDSIHRIDWKRYARSGELATMAFRDERRTAVVLCVDVRRSAIRSPASTEPHAVAYCVAAAQRVRSVLQERGERVGVATFGTEFEWCAPNAGREHDAKIERLLADHEHDHPSPAGNDDTAIAAPERVRQLIARTHEPVEVVLFSPLLDGFGGTAARQLDARGYPVTVVSPNVTTDRTVHEAFAGVERTNRVQCLRNRGVPVADWSPDEPLVWPVGHDGGARR